MKVLIINYTDGGGGGAIAPLRLYNGLKAKGLDVDFAVIEKQSEDDAIFCISRKRTFFVKVRQKLAHYFERFLFRHFKTENGILHSLNLYSLADVNFINRSDYDVVHLHWIAGNTLSIRDIGKITKPLCWTMHDSWAVCGAEHHPKNKNDKRYIEAYTKKNRPKWEQGFDINKWIFNKRKKFYTQPIQFIGPSKWQSQICNDSFIFKHLTHSTVSHIPNILNAECFHPLDKAMAKSIFGIDINKKVLMFSTPYFASPNADVKGCYLLLDALEHFFTQHEYAEFVLLMTGNISTEVKKRLPKVQTMFTGFIQNPHLMNLAYNAADVLLFPSRIENLPYGLLEPHAAGIPCVAFDTGGNSDIVQHKKTGYLAPCFDTNEFAQGINYCLENAPELSHNAIEHIRKNFNADDVLNAHIALYEKIIASEKQQ